MIAAALPSFELSVTETLLALVRGSFVAGLLSSFGSALFLAALAPALFKRIQGGMAGTLARRCQCVVWGSLVAAFVAGLAWLLFETRVIVDAESFIQAMATVPSVLLDTRFGQILALQCLALFGAAVAMASRRSRGPTAAAVLPVSLACRSGAQPRLCHVTWAERAASVASVAFARGGRVARWPSAAVHGGTGTPLEIAEHAARRFSVLGLVSVTILAATSACQGWVLSGGLPGLTGTAYGAVLITKGTLFAVLIALAARNRFQLTPALARPDGDRARRALVQSIAVETAIGLCVVLAAGVLSSLEPGMHKHVFATLRLSETLF